MLQPWASKIKQIWILSFKSILYALAGQEAAKIFEVKIRGRKNINVQPGPGQVSVKSGQIGNFFLFTNFNLKYFLASWPIRVWSTSLKDPIHICFQSESGCGMTFSVCNVGSKCPYSIYLRGFCQIRSDKHCMSWFL